MIVEQREAIGRLQAERAIAYRERAIDRKHALVRVHADLARERQTRDVGRAAIGVDHDRPGHTWQLAGGVQIERDRDAPGAELVPELERATLVGVPRGRVDQLVRDAEGTGSELPLVDALCAAFMIVDLRLHQRHQLRVEQREAHEHTRPPDLDRLPLLEPELAQRARQMVIRGIDQIDARGWPREPTEVLAMVVDEI